MDDFDYVIVGGGSAGCVIANRLSEDSGTRVLLLEAGTARSDWRVRMPAAVGLNLQQRGRLWQFRTIPQAHLNDRRIDHPRGKLLGGTSAINGMCFVRGHPSDFRGWEQAGAVGWDFQHVLPFFRALEDFEGGASALRGAGGPVRIVRPHALNPLSAAFLAAGEEAGFPHTTDVNGRSQEGFARNDWTIRDGQRESSATAYLAPALHRANLSVITGAHATAIRFNALRAIGVATRIKGAQHVFHARRETVLSAGAIGSPQLLMLSGVGPADALRALGIRVQADLPGVGEHLQDHVAVDLSYSVSRPISLAAQSSLSRRMRTGLQWLATRGGPGASSPWEVGAFLRSPHAGAAPDIQGMFIAAVKDRLRPDLSLHGFSLSIGAARIASKGTLQLVSADPAIAPQLNPNYLGEPVDRRRMEFAVNVARQIANQPALRAYGSEELLPGKGVQSAQAIDQFVRSQAFGCYHLSGTCRMGPLPGAVVDEQGRVHGVNGLRVCDASIMPAITNGNTNAPTIMMAEKIAAAIRGRCPAET